MNSKETCRLCVYLEQKEKHIRQQHQAARNGTVNVPAVAAKNAEVSPKLFDKVTFAAIIDDESDDHIAFIDAISLVKLVHRRLQVSAMHDHEILHDAELVAAMSVAQRGHVFYDLRRYQDAILKRDDKMRYMLGRAIFLGNYVYA